MDPGSTNHISGTELLKRIHQMYAPFHADLAARSKMVTIIRVEADDTDPAGVRARAEAARVSAAQKKLAFSEIGLDVDDVTLPSDVAEADFVAVIEQGNDNPAVMAIIVQLPVLAMLPLRLIPVIRSPSLSMANGQWLAFTRAAYDAVGGHAAVRGEVVEDVALGRLVKACGQRLVVCVGASLLAVRMYGGAAAMREGFGKNLYPLLGGRRASFLAALALLSMAWLYPFAAALRGTTMALVPLALLAAVRIAGVLLFRQGWRTVVLHPAGALLAAALAVESWIGHERGGVRWKSRELPPRVSVPAADG